MLTYLSRMRAMWQSIIGEHDPSNITPQTVAAVQARLPHVSRADKQAILESMSKRERGLYLEQFAIFPQISEDRDRKL